jgi:hypothetical protein
MGDHPILSSPFAMQNLYNNMRKTLLGRLVRGLVATIIVIPEIHASFQTPPAVISTDSLTSTDPLAFRASQLAATAGYYTDVYIQKSAAPFPYTCQPQINCETADQLDGYLRTLPARTRIHIGAGTFETRGVFFGGPPNSQKTAGWSIPSECEVSGQGTNSTILKLIELDTTSYDNCVLGNYDPYDSTAWMIAVHDLQIDCNGANLKTKYPGKQLRTQGVCLRGGPAGGHLIQNVLVVNAVGPDSTPQNPYPVENFIISIVCLSGVSQGNVIDNCTVQRFVSGPCSAISMNRWDQGKGYIAGEVRNCRVELSPNSHSFSYNGTRMINVIFRNNFSSGADRAFNNDSIWSESNQFIGNNFQVPTSCFGFHLINGMRHCEIADNTINMVGPNARAIFVSGSTDGGPNIGCGPIPEGLGASELLIRHNTITSVWNGCYGIDLADGCQWTPGQHCQVKDNTVDSIVSNSIAAGTGDITGNIGNFAGPPSWIVQPITGVWAYDATSLAFQVGNKGDFNGDNIPDLVLMDENYNLKTSLLDFNQGVSPKFTTAGSITPTNGNGWAVVASGDLNGDGKADLLLRYPSTGQIGYWLLDGQGHLISGAVIQTAGGSWLPVALGDFDRDGTQDILFQDGDNNFAVWLMNGVQYRTTVALSPNNPGLAWKAVGTGDFNRDGFVDILCQHDGTGLYPGMKGALYVWTMGGSGSGTTLNVSRPINPMYPSDPKWKVAAVDDFNFDNYVDIIFQDSTPEYGGQLQRWLMNCLSKLNERTIPDPPTGPIGAFKVVAPK